MGNKEIIQSYILTAARYDYSIYEKRILYRIVELMQEFIKGKKLTQKYYVQTTITGDMDIQMPVSAFLKDENDTNHSIAKKALMSLNKRQIQCKEGDFWQVINVIERPAVNTKYGWCSFRLHPLIASVFLDFSKGFRKYELKTAMQFDSVYAMRFYEILSGQTAPLTYLIEELKVMFTLENKYKETKDFIRRVISVAKKELDEKSPYSFEYKINKQGKKFHSITFYPVHQPQHRDENIERQKLYNQLSLGCDLSQETIQYLKEVYLFDTKEINQHRDLFKQAEKDLDLLVVLERIKRHTENKNNPKGYVIQVLKNEITKLGGKEKVAEEKTQAPPEPTATASQNPMDMITDLAKMYNQNR